MTINNFFLDAFEWRRWDDYKGGPYSELRSYQNHFSKRAIPGEIFIHGKYRKVRYVYTEYLYGIALAKYIACLEDDPDRKLPEVFIKCSSP
jgi:hypothetical protein